MKSDKEDYSSEPDSSGPEAVPASPRGTFVSPVVRPQHRANHDPNVTFEEYMYYAEKARAEEDASAALAPPATFLDIVFPSKGKARQLEMPASDEKSAVDRSASNYDHARHNDPATQISDLEWTNANRALRSASAAACFYLITTDILGNSILCHLPLRDACSVLTKAFLGPFGVGFSIGTMGWGQGIGLFTLFGLCAGL